MNAMPRGLAVLEHVLVVAVRQVVEVLHADDVDDLAGGLQLLDADLREPDVADLALVDEVLQHPELLLGRDVRVDAVELEQVDGLDVQPAQAHLEALAQVRGASDRVPLVGAGAGQPGLGGDGHVLVPVVPATGVQRLADEVLGDERAVAVGGVDEVDAEVDGAAQHAAGLVRVGGVAPDPGAGDAHGAVAHAV